MAKIKEASSFNGTSWDAAVPIGADATNIDIKTNPSDYDADASETSTTLIGTNDVKIIASDTDLTAWGKFNRFRKRVSNALADLSVIAIQDDTPTRGEKLWLDTSGSGIVIPQINDSIISTSDTWSSNKIKGIGVAVQDSEPLEGNSVWIDTDDTSTVVVPDINEFNNLGNSMAIVVDGNVARTACTAAGQYIILQNSTIANRADGLYTAADTFSAGTIDGTKLHENSPISGGGLNDLKYMKAENLTVTYTQNSYITKADFEGYCAARKIGNLLLYAEFRFWFENLPSSQFFEQEIGRISNWEAYGNGYWCTIVSDDGGVPIAVKFGDTGIVTISGKAGNHPNGWYRACCMVPVYNGYIS